MSGIGLSPFCLPNLQRVLPSEQEREEKRKQLFKEHKRRLKVKQFKHRLMSVYVHGVCVCVCVVSRFID